MLVAELYRQLRRIFRSRMLWLHGVQLAPGPHRLGGGIRARRGFAGGRHGRIVVGRANWWEQGVIVDAHGGSVVLGDHVYLGPYTLIYGHGGVEIGDASLISMHCRILSSNHALPPLGTDIRSQPDELRPTKIGRDVWLGAGVTVLGGVTIGDGCVVGAGAVVTRNLPAGSISYGVPAVVHGKRAESSAAPPA